MAKYINLNNILNKITNINIIKLMEELQLIRKKY